MALEVQARDQVEDGEHVGVDVAAVLDPAKWGDLEWRLDNLYWIVDKNAKAVRFAMNDQQRDLIRNLWYRNVIVKARQLGFSTLVQILQLDQALFNQNHVGATIADTLPNAGKLFGKIEFAYDHLPDALKEQIPFSYKNKGSEIRFDHPGEDGKINPSTIYVAVSSRGGTPNLLHVSELGKISLKFPQRAEEIKTGAFPSVPVDGCIIVESTAEGAFGLFYELAEPAMKRRAEKKPETMLDWRLHFYPWFECRDYVLPDDDVPLVEIPAKMTQYFRKLEAELGITLSRNQRAWYAKTAETLRSKMKQEYPSTPEEAFEQAIEGSIYGEQMTWLREQGRMQDAIGVDLNFPVNTIWDFGTGATNAIWWHQQVGLQHRWFYYLDGRDPSFQNEIKGLRFWWQDVCEAHRLRHGYTWGKHYLPHDADAKVLGEVEDTKHQILEKLGMRNIVVVPRIATIDQGIEITRKALGGNHWFDKRTPDRANGEDLGAGNGIRCLDAYQYEWDGDRGVWSRVPLHNWASHGADSWRQYAQGYTGTTAGTAPDLSAFKNRKRSWR